jgi:hypothetical protein
VHKRLLSVGLVWLCCFGLSLCPNRGNAEEDVNLGKLFQMFREHSIQRAKDKGKPHPVMLEPTTHIELGFSRYAVDIPTYGLKSVSVSEAKLFVSYLDGTSLIIQIEHKLQYPPDVWGLKLDTIIACLMNSKDKLPLEYSKTTERFKEIRTVFWKGVEWTRNRKQGQFNIYQMFRNFAFVEPNTAYMIQAGSDREAVLIHGTVRTEIFTKIADSIRYRSY